MSEAANSEIVLDLSNKDWYVYQDNYGTSEEKYLVKFINTVMNKLKEKFVDIYLLRNEKMFQIYRFFDGAAIEPDYVLFLTDKKSAKPLCYQFFIEPKGTHLIAKDQWKKDFLRSIEREYKLGRTLFEDTSFKIVGMPFYNGRKEE